MTLPKVHKHDGAARTVPVPPQPVAPVIDHLAGPGHPSNRDTFLPGPSGAPAAGQGGGRRDGGAYPKGRGR
jgi:hypothetical protein